MFVLTASTAILGAVILERWIEIMLARRNADRMIEAGAVDHSKDAYLLWMALQGGGLFATAALMKPDHEPEAWGIALFAILLIGRIILVFSHRRHWIFRMLTSASGALIHPLSGRYRGFVEAAMAVEATCLPLLLGSPQLSLVLGPLHAALIVYRLRLEAGLAAR